MSTSSRPCLLKFPTSQVPTARGTYLWGGGGGECSEVDPGDPLFTCLVDTDPYVECGRKSRLNRDKKNGVYGKQKPVR